MNPNTDHLQMIGPWGWLGWLLAIAIALLFYRQWTSDPSTALRNMRKELEEARKTIAELRQLETTLKNRNEELHVQVNTLQADNQDLHAAVQRMKAANEQQLEVITRMEKHQNDLLARLGKCEIIIDGLKDRVVKLEAERGKWADFKDSMA